VEARRFAMVWEMFFRDDRRNRAKAAVLMRIIRAFVLCEPEFAEPMESTPQRSLLPLQNLLSSRQSRPETIVIQSLHRGLIVGRIPILPPTHRRQESSEGRSVRSTARRSRDEPECASPRAQKRGAGKREDATLSLKPR